MKAPLFGHITILGAGLIGGSLAAAIKQHAIAVHVAAFDTSPEGLEYLRTHHYVDSVYDNPAEAVRDAELVILATPYEALNQVVISIAPQLKKGCIVTDVTSIKRQAIAAIVPHLPAHAYFVPGHPIAGSEKSGAAASDPLLFEQKRVILTPAEEEVLLEPVAHVRGLWEALGAHVEYMPAELHDRIYAYVSHLPQLAAFAAKPCVDANAEDSACQGVLRLAKSNMPLWVDICFANADFIREALEEFSTFLTQMQYELLEHDDTAQPENISTNPASLLCSLIALCLVATALLLEQRAGVNAAHYGGSGFKDMVGASGNQSDSVLASISAQPRQVGILLAATVNRLNAIGAALTSGNKEALGKAFS